jgi:bla regulator protein BlaR1
MNLLLINTIAKKMITAFSWMLIHSLWQGLFIAIIAGILLWFAKRTGAAIRYWFLLAFFLMFLAVCTVTFIWEWDSFSVNAATSTVAGNLRGIPALLLRNLGDVKHLLKIFTGYFSVNAPFVVLVWFILFLFKSVKIVGSVIYGRRVKSYLVFEPSEFWVDKVSVLCDKLNIKKTVRLLQSGYIKMPVVIGHLKPVILIPVGVITSLPAGHVEAILLHELAHIRHNDYFVNFLQNIAEAMFFFNPGLLWLSSMLRDERENCCDDVALEQMPSKQSFVEALIGFKEHEIYASKYATAFPGKKNQLLNRVSRILNNKNKAFGFGERMFFMAGLFMFGIIITAIMVTQLKAASKTVSDRTAHRTAHQVIRKENAISKVNRPIQSKVITVAHKIKLMPKMRNGIDGIHHDEGQTTLLTTGSPNTIDLRQQEKVVSEADQAEQDRKDETQAKIDQQQAVKDQQQAERDRAQALKDEIQAKIDQQHAQADQAQAEKDRIKAVSERIKPKMNIVPVKEKPEDKDTHL